MNSEAVTSCLVASLSKESPAVIWGPEHARHQGVESEALISAVNVAWKNSVTSEMTTFVRCTFSGKAPF